MEQEHSAWRTFFLVVWSVLAFVGAWTIVYLVGTGQVIPTLTERLPSGAVILRVIGLAALVAIYPVAYLVYRAYVGPVLERRLRVDFLAMGLVEEEELEETVEELKLVYNRVQYWGYIILIMLVAVLITVGYLDRKMLGSLISPSTMSLVFYGFLGVYVFSVQELIRRYNTNDLRPQVYSSILTRFLVVALLIYVAAAVIENQASELVVSVPSTTAAGAAVAGAQPQPEAEVRVPVAQNEPSPWAAILAFVIGMFPSRGIRWMSKQTSGTLGDEDTGEATLPLGDLAGMSPWHEARLLEMGIDNVQNLATVDIRQMLLATRFDTGQIVNWIDQAILYARLRQRERFIRFRNENIMTMYEYSSRVASLEQEQRKTLVTALKLADDELDDLANCSNYPNFEHIVAYYFHWAEIASERASGSVRRLLEAEGQQNYQRDYKRAIEKYEQQARFYKKNELLSIRVLVDLGVAYFADKQYENAKKQLSSAIELATKLQSKPIRELAGAYSNRAAVNLKLGNFDTVISDCNAAVNLDANNAYTYNYRGVAFWKRAQEGNDKAMAQMAERDFSQALARDDRFAEAYLNRGTARNFLQQFAEAQGDFERACLLGDRSNLILWLDWGNALIGLRRYEDAVEKLSTATALQGPEVAAAHARLGFAYYLMDPPRYQRARSHLEQARELAETQKIPLVQQDAAFYLALIETKSDQIDAAIGLYEKVLGMNGQHYEAWYNLADLYRQKQESDKAQHAYEQVVRIAPDRAYEAWYDLAELYTQKEDLEKARQAYEQVVRIAPEGAMAQAATQSLAALLPRQDSSMSNGSGTGNTAKAIAVVAKQEEEKNEEE